MTKKITRGEIYWVEGSPVLIIQNDIGNQFSSNTIIASLTTAQVRTYPFTVKCSALESGLAKDSIIDLSSLMTISQVRLESRCGRLSDSKMKEVDMALKESLGIGE
jgi:mRNA interferase MazF